MAYKFTSGSFNYTAYRISDKKFYNLSDTSGKGSLDYPLPATARLSSPFNPARLNPVSGKVSPHNGIDYSMPMNTKIVSVIDGKITRAEYNSTMGYFVEVTGKAGVKTRYLHLNKILVTKGARVTRGGAIALSGNSGRSSGPHLHYELVINNNPVNSLAFRAAAPADNNSNSMPLRMPETTNDTWTDNGTATRPVYRINFFIVFTSVMLMISMPSVAVERCISGQTSNNRYGQ